MRAGTRLGVIVGAAAAGVLLGFGIRAGAPLHRFNVTASLVFGERAAFATGFDPAITVTGILVHAGWTLLTGLAFVILAFALGPRARPVLALTLAASLVLLQRRFTPWIGGSGTIAPFTPAQAIALGIVVALALLIGMRLALSEHGRR